MKNDHKRKEEQYHLQTTEITFIVTIYKEYPSHSKNIGICIVNTGH